MPLSYDTLAIGNVTDASAAFYNLKQIEDKMERESTRKALLEYCGLDTFATVKILEKLRTLK